MNYFLSFSIITIFFYRLFLLYIHSAFFGSEEQLLSIICGFISDWSLISFFLTLSSLYTLLFKNSRSLLLKAGLFSLGLLWLFLHAANLRYVEYFKMNFRIFHLHTTQIDGMLSVFLKMFLAFLYYKYHI